MLNGKKVLITGATGSFGNRFIDMTLEKYQPKRLIVFSRDEMKQWEMRKRYENLPVDFFLGDVRDVGRLRRAFQGVDIVIHAAALKIVPTAEYDPLEYVKTNVMGAANVIEAAIDCGVRKVVALSTDKACSPINLYGATKLCSDKLFLAANSYCVHGHPMFSVVRYGNVMGSRGSVIPLFLEQAKRGEITITDPGMTRFMITLDEAVELVWKALEDPEPKIHIPRLPAMNIIDLANAVWNFARNPETDPGSPLIGNKNPIWRVAQWRVIGIRPGEKLHEELDLNYTSEKPDRWYTKEELRQWLISNYGPSQTSTPSFSTPYSTSETRLHA